MTPQKDQEFTVLFGICFNWNHIWTKFKNTGFAIEITLIHSNFGEINGFESNLGHPGSAC